MLESIRGRASHTGEGGTCARARDGRGAAHLAHAPSGRATGSSSSASASRKSPCQSSMHGWRGRLRAVRTQLNGMRSAVSPRLRPRGPAASPRPVQGKQRSETSGGSERKRALHSARAVAVDGVVEAAAASAAAVADGAAAASTAAASLKYSHTARARDATSGRLAAMPRTWRRTSPRCEPERGCGSARLSTRVYSMLSARGNTCSVEGFCQRLRSGGSHAALSRGLRERESARRKGVLPGFSRHRPTLRSCRRDREREPN